MPPRSSVSEHEKRGATLQIDEHFDAMIEVPTSSRLKKSRTNNGGWLVGQLSKSRARFPAVQLAVLAGGCASAAVDVIIFPLDSIKNSLQAPQGFNAAGGYRGLFTGVLAAA